MPPDSALIKAQGRECNVGFPRLRGTSVTGSDG